MSEAEYRIVVNDYAFLDLSEPTITLFANNDMQGIVILAQGDLSDIPEINPEHGPMVVMDPNNTQTHPLVGLAFDKSADLRDFITMLQTLEKQMNAREHARQA